MTSNSEVIHMDVKRPTRVVEELHQVAAKLWQPMLPGTRVLIQTDTRPRPVLGYNRSFHGSHDDCPAGPPVQPQIHLPRGGGGPGAAADRFPRLRLLVLSRGEGRAAAGGRDDSSRGPHQSGHRDLRRAGRSPHCGVQPAPTCCSRRDTSPRKTGCGRWT